MQKEQKHMSLWGVGPVYVIICSILTVCGILLVKKEVLSNISIQGLNIPLKIISVICIMIGIILWIMSAIISNIDKNIKENKLVTTGIYAWVRNPIYSAFAFVFTGILLWQNNLFLFVFPILFWIIMTVLVKKEEKVLYDTFGQEYLNYKRQINRCIPWFPKNRL